MTSSSAADSCARAGVLGSVPAMASATAENSVSLIFCVMGVPQYYVFSGLAKLLPDISHS